MYSVMPVLRNSAALLARPRRISEELSSASSLIRLKRRPPDPHVCTGRQPAVFSLSSIFSQPSCRQRSRRTSKFRLQLRAPSFATRRRLPLLRKRTVLLLSPQQHHLPSPLCRATTVPVTLALQDRRRYGGTEAAAPMAQPRAEPDDEDYECGPVSSNARATLTLR